MTSSLYCTVSYNSLLIIFQLHSFKCCRHEHARNVTIIDNQSYRLFTQNKYMDILKLGTRFAERSLYQNEDSIAWNVSMCARFVNIFGKCYFSSSLRRVFCGRCLLPHCGLEDIIVATRCVKLPCNKLLPLKLREPGYLFSNISWKYYPKYLSPQTVFMTTNEFIWQFVLRYLRALHFESTVTK
jgi:hypothetical protein